MSARSLLCLAALITAGCATERVEYRKLPSYYEAAGIRPEPTRLPDGTLLVYEGRDTRKQTNGKTAGGDSDTTESPEDGPPARAMLPEQVLTEVLACILDEDYERLYNGILSARTRSEYEAQGMGEEDVAAFFRENRDELYAALNRMSIGLRGPEVIVEPGPFGGTRCRFHPIYAKDFGFTTVDLIYEDLGLKLLMIR